MMVDSLLAAPILRPGQREREVYLPDGLWYDFWTNQRHEGQSLIRVDAPIETSPLFARGGRIIPSTVPMNYTSEKAWDPITFTIYPNRDGEARGALYEDDGISQQHAQGAYRHTRISYESHVRGATIQFSSPKGSYQAPNRSILINLIAPPAFTNIATGDRELSRIHEASDETGWWTQTNGVLSIRIPDTRSAQRITLR